MEFVNAVRLEMHQYAFTSNEIYSGIFQFSKSLFAVGHLLNPDMLYPLFLCIPDYRSCLIFLSENNYALNLRGKHFYIRIRFFSKYFISFWVYRNNFHSFLLKLFVSGVAKFLGITRDTDQRNRLGIKKLIDLL